MNTLAFLTAATALLAGAGWLIGWQIARASRTIAGPPIVIVASVDKHASLQAALRRLGLEPNHFILLTEAPLRKERFVRITLDIDGHAICRATRQSPSSYALQQIPMDHASSGDWTTVAQTALYHLDVVTQPVGDSSCQPSALDEGYRAAWSAMQKGEQHNLRAAHERFTDVAARWPDDREIEKSCVLANLAVVCSRLDEEPRRRLARLLQGLDAVREAIALQYIVPEEYRMRGLRALMHRLQEAVRDHEKRGKEPATHASQPHGESSRPWNFRPRTLAQPASAVCPQANAMTSDETRASGAPNTL